MNSTPTEPISQFDKTTESKADDSYPKTFSFNGIRQDDCAAAIKRESFKAGRNSAKESLEILAKAAEQASFPLGIPLEFIQNPEPRAMAKWLNAELKDRSDTLRYAIAAVKARGDWPIAGKEGEV